MREIFITYETAKLAKDKEFNIPVLIYYDGSEMIATQSKNVFDEKDYNKHKESTFYSAPTQSLLQKWLREKHQIFIEVVTDCTCEPKFCFYIHQFTGNPRNLAEKEWYWSKPEFEFYLYRTYEQALEEALIISLNLI